MNAETSHPLDPKGKQQTKTNFVFNAPSCSYMEVESKKKNINHLETQLHVIKISILSMSYKLHPCI